MDPLEIHLPGWRHTDSPPPDPAKAGREDLTASGRRAIIAKVFFGDGLAASEANLQIER